MKWVLVKTKESEALYQIDYMHVEDGVLFLCTEDSDLAFFAPGTWISSVILSEDDEYLKQFK